MFGHHSKTYYKYLASYGALLLTAIIALVFVSQVFFIRQLRTNLEDNHRALVQQSVQEMDSDLQQIYNIEYQISTVNQNFFSYYLEAPSPVRDLRLVNEFKNLLAPSTLISEIALADADAKMVYTSTAVYSAPWRAALPTAAAASSARHSGAAARNAIWRSSTRRRSFRACKTAS